MRGILFAVKSLSDGDAREQIICRLFSRPMKRKRKMHRMIISVVSLKAWTDRLPVSNAELGLVAFKGNSKFCFPESLSLGEDWGSSENQKSLFPVVTVIKYFVIPLH